MVIISSEHELPKVSLINGTMNEEQLFPWLSIYDIRRHGVPTIRHQDLKIYECYVAGQNQGKVVCCRLEIFRLFITFLHSA